LASASPNLASINGVNGYGETISGMFHALEAAAKSFSSVLAYKQTYVEVAKVEALGVVRVKHHIPTTSNLKSVATKEPIGQLLAISLLPRSSCVFCDENVAGCAEVQSIWVCLRYSQTFH
jgi:hypothetical protein